MKITGKRTNHWSEGGLTYIHGGKLSLISLPPASLNSSVGRLRLKIMIASAEEFYRLRTSEIMQEYNRAAHNDAPLEVWLEVIEKFPEMRCWVAHNKTVPVEILEILSRDKDPRVRSFVAMKRKLPEHLQILLAQDKDCSVRERLANNAKATDLVLRILAEDVELRIREKAKARLSEIA